MRTEPKNHDAWINQRKNGIGASESACIIGLNPYKTNVDLWMEKAMGKEQKDISDKPAVAYGKVAESPLRELFVLDFPQYKVEYSEFAMISNLENHPYIFATLDGELTDIETGKKGILEIKTTQIMNNIQWTLWEDRVPDNYFVQILHQFLATGYDFAWLKAQIKYHTKSGDLKAQVRHYYFERDNYKQDLKALLKAITEFWRAVQVNERPALILPEI